MNKQGPGKAEEVPDEWADMIINEAGKHDVPVWVKDNYGYPQVIKEFPEMMEV